MTNPTPHGQVPEALLHASYLDSIFVSEEVPASRAAQPASAMREAVAKAIYDQWVHKDGWVAWVSGGNSFRQDDARRLADLAFAMAQPAPQQEAQEPVAWNSLTDEDRERAMNSMPGMLEGFMKTWGWLHFAKAIEAICREKNAQPSPAAQGNALDAARYRWLRNKSQVVLDRAWFGGMTARNHYGHFLCRDGALAALDAAIDAARKQGANHD